MSVCIPQEEMNREFALMLGLSALRIIKQAYIRKIHQAVGKLSVERH